MVEQRRFRDVNGIVLLDKPVGITSNTALQIVKRIFRARKAGHTGSLDPLASGLLPLCLGDATKISPFLLEADKRYEVAIRLGIKTSTGDAEGRMVSTQTVPPVSEDMLRTALARFSGPVQQIPPMHSAIKHQGQPLYKLAHQGIEIERQPRQIVIHELIFRGYRDEVLELEVHCSKGTYIRTLAEDIGVTLGVGAHVIALRRTVSGPFRAEQMVTLAALQEQAAGVNPSGLEATLLPMEAALAPWPDVCLSEDMAHYLKQGQAVFVPRAPTSGWVKLRTADQRFLGVGRVLDDGRVAPKRLVGGHG